MIVLIQYDHSTPSTRGLRQRAFVSRFPAEVTTMMFEVEDLPRSLYYVY